MEPQQPWRGADPRNPPAWPLGCVTAGLAVILIINLLGLGGIVFAASGLPLWVERGGPVLLALLVPVLMLGGGLALRRRNAYSARVLLWACLITVAGCGALTIVANIIDWLTVSGA